MPSKTYRSPIEVRGYELDSFGHVNHSIYVNYLEHARWKLLEEEGIRLKEFEKWQKWPVIGRLEITYVKPTFMGEHLEVQTVLEQHGRTAFLAHQTIVRGDQVVLKAKVLVVVVNEKGRPTELPDEVKNLAPPTLNGAAPL